MEIPKTLIIGIYLHGEIHLNENGDVNNDRVPDGMRLNVINGVAPGVPNISTLEDYENMAKKISNRIKRRDNYTKLTKTQIDDLCLNLRDLLVRTNKNQANDILKEHQRLFTKKQVNPTFQKFSYQYENSFIIKKYESNHIITNKVFIKFSEGEVINPYNIPENYFNKIVLYNLEGEPDLFELLKSVNLDIEEITFAQLMEFLVNLGVENLIIIDLSCSVFKGDSKYLSDRNIRQTRRKLLHSY